jgi:hypothetical protein
MQRVESILRDVLLQERAQNESWNESYTKYIKTIGRLCERLLLPRIHRGEQETLPMNSPRCHIRALSGEGRTDILPFEVMAPPWFAPDGEWATSTSNWCGPFGTLPKDGSLIHGTHELPPDGQYELVIVPANADVIPLSRPDLDLSGPRKPSANPKTVLPILITLYQICYGTVSLYRARGDQIDLYGYTAFGLTVIPYVIMAIINLLTQLLSNDYPDLYMIQSLEMDEAIRRGGRFEGVVGTLRQTEVNDSSGPLDHESTQNSWKVATNSTDRESESITLQNTRSAQRLTITKRAQSENAPQILVPCCSMYVRHKHRRQKLLFYGVSPYDIYIYLFSRDILGVVLTTYAPLFINGVAIAINGGISHFQHGSRSTPVQRGFALTWMIFNGFYGQWGQWFLDIGSLYFAGSRDTNRIQGMFHMVGVCVTFFTPAIGGMVLAGIEMSRYGSCTRLAS